MATILRRNRDRKNVLVYRRNIEEYLTERGKEHRVADFVARLNCAAPPAKHSIL